MPFISTKTNVTITPEKETVLKEKFGRAISILGKGEGWLMLDFEGGHSLWFKGKNEMPMAIVDISLFGKATESAYDRMTGEITDILASELGISKDCIYVKYEEVKYWGWNGNNF